VETWATKGPLILPLAQILAWRAKAQRTFGLVSTPPRTAFGWPLPVPDLAEHRKGKSDPSGTAGTLRVVPVQKQLRPPSSCSNLAKALAGPPAGARPRSRQRAREGIHCPAGHDKKGAGCQYFTYYLQKPNNQFRKTCRIFMVCKGYLSFNRKKRTTTMKAIGYSTAGQRRTTLEIIEIGPASGRTTRSLWRGRGDLGQSRCDVSKLARRRRWALEGAWRACLGSMRWRRHLKNRR